jgi:NAD(P)-dependent dehydrogenase (short-subunit alcohol dehydrogenase family)
VDYRDQVAVVTGASSGLGRRLALDLAAAGSTVVGMARREDLLSTLGTPYRVCDVGNVPSYVEALRAVENEHGRIDILLNVAGRGGALPSEPAAVGTTRDVFEVNFFAPYAGMLQVLPGMRARGHGVIANMSSDDGRAPGPGAGDYSSSKAALSAATESVAFEARADGVAVHVVYPGWVPTEMGRAAVETGGMKLPPRSTRRTEEQVSALVLRRLGGPRLDINAAPVAVLAPVVRALAPRAYRRMRATR